ncbi:MAG TPA: hypothetical protein VGC99_18800, partial [Candidatus Tectomicrobia bacterium]
MGVRIVWYVQNSVKLFYGHVWDGCTLSVVFGQVAGLLEVLIAVKLGKRSTTRPRRFHAVAPPPEASGGRRHRVPPALPGGIG